MKTFYQLTEMTAFSDAAIREILNEVYLSVITNKPNLDRLGVLADWLEENDLHSNILQWIRPAVGYPTVKKPGNIKVVKYAGETSVQFLDYGFYFLAYDKESNLNNAKVVFVNIDMGGRPIYLFTDKHYADIPTIVAEEFNEERPADSYWWGIGEEGRAKLPSFQSEEISSPLLAYLICALVTS